jgi:hypothetical protein
MAFGPVLISDKSTLQSLNSDESVWLDNFFLTNITPLFYIETLADLEKEVRLGKTPEQVVDEPAYQAKYQFAVGLGHFFFFCSSSFFSSSKINCNNSSSVKFLKSLRLSASLACVASSRAIFSDAIW